MICPHRWGQVSTIAKGKGSTLVVCTVPGCGARAVSIPLSGRTLDVTAGLWCEACALPSVLQGVVAVSMDGQPYGVMRMDRCTACGAGGCR